MSNHTDSPAKKRKIEEKPIELGYWAIRGIAQPIRLSLEYAGKSFRLKQHERTTTNWNKQKNWSIGANWKDRLFHQGPPPEFSRESGLKWKRENADDLDFPNLPFLIDGDVKLTQSRAILRYVGRKFNLGPNTEHEHQVFS